AAECGGQKGGCAAEHILRSETRRNGEIAAHSGGRIGKGQTVTSPRLQGLMGGNRRAGKGGAGCRACEREYRILMEFELRCAKCYFKSGRLRRVPHKAV